MWQRPSEYSPEPYPITRALIEEGRKHLLLGGLIETGCPVRILQGVEDPDVPWQHAVELCRGSPATTWCSRWSRTATIACRGRRTSSG